MSLTEQAVHVNRHVSVNTYQKGEAGERHLGAVTEDAKEQRQVQGKCQKELFCEWISYLKSQTARLKL